MSKIFTKRNSLILLIIWLLIIFVFSNMNGEVSYNVSTAVLNKITGGISDKESFDLFHLLLRKLAHVFEYFILCALTYNYFRFYFQGKKLYIFVFIFTLICSNLDELHQLFMTGREGKIIDVLIDSIGAIIFLILIIIHKKNVTKRKSN